MEKTYEKSILMIVRSLNTNLMTLNQKVKSERRYEIGKFFKAL